MTYPTLHSRLSALHLNHIEGDTPTEEDYWTLDRGLARLLNERDREAQLLAALLNYRSSLGTGPVGGQVRASISAILIDVYGREAGFPEGVFDE